MATMKNPQSKPINQKRGPQTGNAGNPTKRSTFMAEKSKTGSEKSALADVVTRALEMRGRGQAGKTNPALEGLHENTNTGRGPTKGNAGKRK
jgi:hypothetical protein